MSIAIQLSSSRFVRFVAVAVFASVAAVSLHASPLGTCGAQPSASLVSELTRQARNLDPAVLRLALSAAACADEKGLVRKDDLLTVIDYSKPSTEPRLFVFDLEEKRMLFRELVAHGKNSGGTRSTSFSNVEGSLASSIGLYVTDHTYVGSNGYSLKLKGLDRGYNDNAWSRAIVMHGAKYVSNAGAEGGWIGRSWGCPAVRTEISRRLIDTVKGGSPIFSYYPDPRWLQSSAYLRRATSEATLMAGGR